MSVIIGLALWVVSILAGVATWIFLDWVEDRFGLGVPAALGLAVVCVAILSAVLP